MEVWLEEAQLSLDRDVQQRVEEQLQTCQEMFVEIEQKVASVSASGHDEEEQKAISTKLQILKNKLVTFQLQLQERYSGEKVRTESGRPLQGRLKRSSSVQEMLSSSKCKLFRQSSLQQQRELEQGLSEQRDLTKVIAAQRSRHRLQSLPTEEHARLSVPAALPANEKQDGSESVHRKWTHLHRRLSRRAEEQQEKEDELSQISTQISPPPQCMWGSTNGAACLQELQSHITHLRDLGHTASSAGDVQVVDEGFFEVLSGIALSLSSLSHTLVSQPGPTHTDTHNQLVQLQSLSAELTSLSAELTSQGSEVLRSLGSVAPAANVCMDLLQDRLGELQDVLSDKQKQVQKQLDHTVQKQSRIKHMHAALLANTLTLKTLTQEESLYDLHAQLQAVAGLHQELQQKERELAELRDETVRQGTSGPTLDVTTLENVWESAYAGVCQRAADLRYTLDQQQQCERLLKGLQDLVELGKQRLSHAVGLELHSPEQLHTHLSTHTKFFLSLDAHVRALQCLSARMPDGALSSWRAVMSELEGQVDHLQCQARENSSTLQMALQLWTQWEESRLWLDKLLQEMEAQLNKMQLEEQTEEALQQNLSTYQSLQETLNANGAQIGLVLDQVCRLHRVGVSGRLTDKLFCKLGVASLKLKQRLCTVQRRIEHGRDSVHHLIKLWSRFQRDSASLTEWMDKTRERLDTWTSPNQDATHSASNFTEFMDLCRDLELKSALKASVVSSGTELLQLTEREHSTHLPSTKADHQASNKTPPSEGSTDISVIRKDPEADLMKTDPSSVREALASQTTLSANAEAAELQEEAAISSPDDPQTENESTQVCRSEKAISGDASLSDSLVQVMALSPVLLSLKDSLTRVEHSWMEINSDITAVQQQLHQCMVDRISPESLLSEVCKWISEAEGRLQETERDVQCDNTTTQLTKQLSAYKELKRMQVCVQVSVDFLNQTMLKQSENCRYKHTEFAEQLGEINLRWTSLSTHLHTQTQHTEQRLRTCTERDAKLRLLQAWVSGREDWLRAAETPASLSAAEKSLTECKVLEEESKVKSAELSELRKRRVSDDDEEHTDAGFIRRVNDVSRALATFSEQNLVLKRTLEQRCETWSRFESEQSLAVQNALRIHQALERPLAPHATLTALQKSVIKMQVLQKETEETDSRWEELNQAFSALIGGIHPNSAHLLSEQVERDRARWTEVKQALAHTSVRLHTLLQAWKRYSHLSESCSEKLQQQKDSFSDVSKAASEHNGDTESLTTCLKNLHDLKKNAEHLQSDLDRALEGSKELMSQMEPTAAAIVQSECRWLARGFFQLGRAVAVKLQGVQEDLKQLQEFETRLESLETQLEQWTNLQRGADTQDADKAGLLELSRGSADVELLNESSYRMTLSDPVTRRLQNLTRKWAQASAHAQERCSELLAVSLQQQAFEERCESWMRFLQRMEDSLAGEVASTYPALREQLRTHQRFQAELSLGHQILHSVITEALHLLQRGEVEDRSDFLLKLAQLREHWQGAVQRAAQRRALVDGLIRHWHLYTHTLRKLNTLLTLTHTLLQPASLTHCSVLQLRRSLTHLQRTEQLFHRSLSAYLLLLDVGRQLFSVSDEETQTRLQTDLGALQEDWERSQGVLAKRRALTADIIKTWESCVSRLADLTQRLEEIKARLKQPDEMEEEVIKVLFN